MSIAPNQNWTQSGNFNSSYYGGPKKIAFINNDKYDYLKQIELVEKPGFFGPTTYSIILHLNYDGDTVQWLIDAKTIANGLKTYSGSSNFNYFKKGEFEIELKSLSQVPSVMSKINSDFADNELPAYVLTSLYNVAAPLTSTTPKLSIFEYAHKGNLFDVESSLKSGNYKVHDKEPNGQDLLHIAFSKGNKDLAKLALRYGASIDSKNNSDKTILALAVETGDRSWYEFAISNNANKKISDYNYDNLLHTALKCYKNVLKLNSTGSFTEKARDYKFIIKDLSSKNHDLVKQYNIQGDTPISLATEIRGDKSIFDGLINDIKNDYGTCDVLAKELWDNTNWDNA